MKKWILFIVLVSTLSAQAQRKNDAASWLSLVLEQKLKNNFSLKFQSRFRFGDNVSQLNSYYLDLGLFYRITPNFKVSFDGVYAPYRMDNGMFTSLFQYYVSISNSIDLSKKWTLGNRVISQFTTSDFIVDNGTLFYMRADVREKLTLNYELNKKTGMYVSDEIMSPFTVSPVLIRRNRLYVGLNRKLSKQVDLDLYFLLQSTFYKTVNTNDFVYGLTLGYKFKKWKKD
jgi:hypothetical protein